MSGWFSVSLQTESPDKRNAVFTIKNTTLQPLRARAVAAAVEMAPAAPFDEAFFHVDPALFTLEPGEERGVSVSLTPKAPTGRKLSVRLRVEKADLTDHFEHGPGVELGTEIIPRKPIPAWVWFAIGGAVVVALVIGIIFAVTRPQCEKASDCSNGFQCKDGECSCGSLEECPSSSPLCHQNQCKPNCTLSGNVCSSGQYCDPNVKVCRPGCDDNGDCPKGFSCNIATHECKCGNVKVCATGDVCHNNQCRDACSATKKCPTGQHCELAAGACMPGCETDANCNDGFSCKNGTCMCGTKKTCSSKEVCFDEHCVMTCGPGKPSCKGDAYCFENAVCLPPCEKTSDCPDKYKCDETTHTCKCFTLNCFQHLGKDRWEKYRSATIERPLGIRELGIAPNEVPHPVPSALVPPSPPQPNP